MLAKRIIPCLDVKDNQVVKGVQFRQHRIVGDIVTLAQRYAEQGADELVFYDISASSDQRIVDKQWITKIAQSIDIPFCVAGGIKTVNDAKTILANGADKISINSPALANPDLINQLAKQLGRQCVVVGIDSYYDKQADDYFVYQYTGNAAHSRRTSWRTQDWLQEVQLRGAGEIVLNMMNQDGVKQGYDLRQLQWLRPFCQVPLIASGGAGEIHHFVDVFQKGQADGALAASVFHQNIMVISQLKEQLNQQGVCVRLC